MPRFATGVAVRQLLLPALGEGTTPRGFEDRVSNVH